VLAREGLAEAGPFLAWDFVSGHGRSIEAAAFACGSTSVAKNFKKPF
jgi:hypothetical protein